MNYLNLCKALLGRGPCDLKPIVDIVSKTNVRFVRPVLIPALGPVGEGLENWSKDNLGYNLDLSASRIPLCIFGLLAAVVIVAWHFVRAFLVILYDEPKRESTNPRWNFR